MPCHICSRAVILSKVHLDKWLRTIPDTPKIDNYGASMSAESNIICDQAEQVGQAGDPIRG